MGRYHHWKAVHFLVSNHNERCSDRAGNVGRSGSVEEESTVFIYHVESVIKGLVTLLEDHFSVHGAQRGSTWGSK